MDDDTGIYESIELRITAFGYAGRGRAPAGKLHRQEAHVDYNNIVDHAFLLQRSNTEEVPSQRKQRKTTP